MATYLGELVDHVRSLNEGLLALEKDPSPADRTERFHSLFRAVHSLKGASRSVGVIVIEQSCHWLEELLAAARDGRLNPGDDVYSVLFASVDAIEEAGMRLREQRDLTESPLAELLPKLEALAVNLAEGEADPQAWASTAPSKPPIEAPRPKAPEPGPAPMPAPEPVAQAPASKTAPVVAEESAAEPASSSASSSSSSSAADADRSLNSSFVRLPAEKLDVMLARSGELHVARRRVESHYDDLADLRDSFRQWMNEWQSAVKPLRKTLARGTDKSDHAYLPVRTLQAFVRAGDHLAQFEKQLESLGSKMAGDRRHLAQAAGQLDEEVRRVRMLPFSDACQGLDRTVRDLARVAGKEVRLVIEGGQVELDRSVLEWLRDPLLHLVRNAVDHGIEPPERRRMAGKPAKGLLTVKASLRGDLVEVVVSDDGEGIDHESLREAARRRGIPEPADTRDLTELIFKPGFSTSTIITNISGRGVGLDVVKNRLEALHGSVEMSSEPGKGTRFTLTVPLTLTTLRALLVQAGGHTFALASANVHRLVRIDWSHLRTVEGRPMLILGGPPVPVAPLSAVLGMPQQESQLKGKLPAIIVTWRDRKIALVVDELIAEQEVIVKSLGDRIRRVRLVSGATILSSGRIALVLNTSGLVRGGMTRRVALPTVAPTPTPDAAMRKRLIVVDDSVTTRTLEKSILEAAGYDVSTAVDGEAGWELLQEQGADLLISDIEMPRLDGFSLTAKIRASQRFEALPVILISSRSSDQDKARGVEVGADAYIVKGAFDQNDLVATVQQLL
ncbi:hybrid sensor histidine kinase/response regulator [Singulisphaera sp. PoT]|uniref:hybrid sensor histidine kinase/response regulator n=1 Tax=Singulisphaera sp. PoT TaxID=3411797 RepID=UPI003BF592C9